MWHNSVCITIENDGYVPVARFAGISSGHEWAGNSTRPGANLPRPGGVRFSIYECRMPIQSIHPKNEQSRDYLLYGKSRWLKDICCYRSMTNLSFLIKKMYEKYLHPFEKVR